jgi:hypothetical protein
MRPTARTQILPALLVLSVGCGEAVPDRADLVVTDSAGIALVTGPALDRPLGWPLVEMVRFGGADTGAAAFTTAGVETVMTDGAERIFVYDRDASMVRVFDATGQAIRSMGGPGAGPGEIQFAMRLFDVGPGRIAIFDYGKNALLTWSVDGDLLSEAPPGLGEGSWNDWTRRGDTVVISRTHEDSVRVRSEVSMITARDTTILDSLITPPRAMAELGCFMARMPPIFTPGLAFAVRGDRLAILRQDRYVVDLYRSGRREMSLRRDIAGRPTTSADGVRQYPEGMKVAFGGGAGCTVEAATVVEKVGMADHLTVLHDVAFGPGGSVWVQRQSFPGDPLVTDVFDEAGRYLGTDTGHGLPLGELSGGRVLFAAADTSTGVTRIGIHAVPELSNRP